jgi:nucleoside-diphosphate-sugar epimerase
MIITGANGFIGIYLADYFSSLGYVVTAFVYSQPAHKRPDIFYHPYDLDQPVDQSELAGCDTVIHCAYIKSGDNARADEINFKGTRNLYDSAKKAGVKKFIFFSSLSAHEQALSHYGQMKFKIESLLDPATDLILKPGLVIGYGGLFQDIAGYLQRSALIPLVDRGRNLVQCIALNDLAKCIDAAIHKNIAGNFALAAKDPVTMREMYQFISEKMNRKIILLPVPFWWVNLGFIVLGALHIKTPVTRENLLGLKQNLIWDVSEAIRVFGIEFKSCQQAIKELDLEHLSW